METIMLLILAIAVEYDVPPQFALSIAMQENSMLSPSAVGRSNADGTRDLGVMQLNERYFSHVDWECPEENIRAGVQHLKWLIDRPEVQTFWDVAVAYNAGLSRLEIPPDSSIEYANQVMWRWHDMSGGNEQTLIVRQR